MYKVTIQWEDQVFTHVTYSKREAYQYLHSYPKRNIFGVIYNIFGQRLAVRYFR
jgi:hypothetical protein